MFARITVGDYATYRAIFDSLENVRRAAGVTAQSVFQSADDPNDITVTRLSDSRSGQGIRVVRCIARGDEDDRGSGTADDLVCQRDLIGTQGPE